MNMADNNNYITEKDRDYKINKLLTFYMVYKGIINETPDIKINMETLETFMERVSEEDMKLVKDSISPKNFKEFTSWMNDIIIQRMNNEDAINLTQFVVSNQGDIFTNLQMSKLFEKLGSKNGSSMSHEFRKKRNPKLFTYPELRKYITQNVKA